MQAHISYLGHVLHINCTLNDTSIHEHICHLSPTYLLLTVSESPDTLMGALRGMDSLLLLCWVLTDCADFLLGGPHSLCTYYQKRQTQIWV